MRFDCRIVGEVYTSLLFVLKYLSTWRVRQAVKPQPSQGCITGSNPVRATIHQLLLYIKEFLFFAI